MNWINICAYITLVVSISVVVLTLITKRDAVSFFLILLQAIPMAVVSGRVLGWW